MQYSHKDLDIIRIKFITIGLITLNYKIEAYLTFKYFIDTLRLREIL